ncbi:MAG: tetratricopeptide repeat protein [Deltaproteobacteria bacterium]|nr:tetratricopeptide repeat protein [Deltaproteobacteria bacterium]MCX7952331.1 tetratricopeptide repeat protein [Deltaproteobacteria bacterium]
MVRVILLLLASVFSQDLSEEIKKAKEFFQQGLYIDARDKLLEIIKKNPQSLEALVLVMEYYSNIVSDPDEVLEYNKLAKEALKTANILDRIQFYDLVIYYEFNALSQKNKYEEALRILQETERKGYLPPWYFSSLSWILFKLGRFEEAVEAAEKGLNFYGDQVSSLNMLGIIYGVLGRWNEAIEVLKKAKEIGIITKQSIAAPLNNLAEIHEELFNETLALQLYEEAIKGDTDCSALLSYINLAFLYLDFLDTRSAKKVLNDYKSCVSKFPFKSPKSFRSLINLVEARINLIEGRFEEARRLSKWILDYEQQLGSIGTDENDLKAATLQTILLANTGLARRAKFDTEGFFGPARSWFLVARLNFENILYRRELANILFKKLNKFEDLRIKNSDSFLFYPFLGFELANWNRQTLGALITKLRAKDTRNRVFLYYDLYTANLIKRFDEKILKQNLGQLRAYYDEALSAAYLIKLLQHENLANEKERLASLLYDKWPQAFIIFRLSLPVYSESHHRLLRRFNFDPVAKKDSRFNLSIAKDQTDYKLNLVDKKGKSIIVRDENLRKGIQVLSKKVFGL